MHKAFAISKGNRDWYDRMIGYSFRMHPFMQTAMVDVVDPRHPATAGLRRALCCRGGPFAPVVSPHVNKWMGFEAFLHQYRGLLALLSVLATVNVLSAHRALLRLQTARPALLEAVGIRRIDWWPRCVFGVCRLGFSAAGRELPMRLRVQFQAVALTYAVLIGLVLRALVDVARLL